MGVELEASESVDDGVATALDVSGRLLEHRAVHVEVNEAADALRHLDTVGEQIDRQGARLARQHYGEVFKQRFVFLAEQKTTSYTKSRVVCYSTKSSSYNNFRQASLLQTRHVKDDMFDFGLVVATNAARLETTAQLVEFAAEALDFAELV